MTSISVEPMTFTFDPSVVPFQYEKDAVCVAGWPQGSKVVDVVAHDLPEPAALTWLIEVKAALGGAVRPQCRRQEQSARRAAVAFPTCARALCQPTSFIPL